MDIDSTITAVTVFVDRARVTRTAGISLEAGIQKIVLRGLPMRIDPESVRVAGRGDGVKIAGVDVVTEFHTEAPEANVSALQTQLEDLALQDRVYADEEASLAVRADMLDKLKASSGAEFAKGLAFGRIGVDALHAVTDYIFEQHTAMAARKRELDRQRLQLAKLITAVKGRLQQVEQPKKEQRRSIAVELEAAQAAQATLEVTYMVTGAKWKSHYDLRLNGDTLAVSYLAGVEQQSGEDWPSLALSLSTARPATTKTVPELPPWYLSVFVPRPMPQSVPAPVAAAPMMARHREFSTAAAPEPPPPPAPMQNYQASVEASGASVTYRIGRPLAVPSDGSTHRALVANFDLPAQLDYITAPKIAEEAYLRAKIMNNSEYVMLAGKANIFHGDEFVGATEIPVTAAKEELELQLGIDDRVKVERELASRDVSKTFIGNNRRVQYGYRIKLQSLLDRPAKITVLDQLPHSTSEEIKVKPMEIKPQPLEHSELSILRWDTTLLPNQKVEIVFGFQVEYPRQLNITGLRD